MMFKLFLIDQAVYINIHMLDLVFLKGSISL